MTRYHTLFLQCHSGILGGGHYTSFAKNPNGKWYYFNDSSCKETTEERVLQESPYMLFYELQGVKKEVTAVSCWRSTQCLLMRIVCRACALI